MEASCPSNYYILNPHLDCCLHAIIIVMGFTPGHSEQPLSGEVSMLIGNRILEGCPVVVSLDKIGSDVGVVPDLFIYLFIEGLSYRTGSPKGFVAQEY